MTPNEIEVDTVVSVHYSLTLDSGAVVDTSRGREPLHYLHGHGQIVPGLEEELTGRKVGERVQVRVDAERGYGERVEDGVQQVPRSSFPAELELAPGAALNAKTQDGQMVQLHVVEVGADTVTVDFNHPLAGQVLHFDVEILAVRPATQQELAHGHVHGPGGHEHH